MSEGTKTHTRLRYFANFFMSISNAVERFNDVVNIAAVGNTDRYSNTMFRLKDHPNH